MERLKHMKESLMCCIENQLNHLESVDTKELGEAIDMIKDLEEAIYYKTVVDAMHEAPKEKEDHMYYRDMDRDKGRMYYGTPWYPEDRGRRMNYGGVMYYDEGSGGQHNDAKDGRSYRSRRMYMEAKETHADKNAQMRELENYMQELTQDVVEMVEGASQEEKQYLSKRVAALANKLAQLND